MFSQELSIKAKKEFQKGNMSIIRTKENIKNLKSLPISNQRLILKLLKSGVTTKKGSFIEIK